MSTAPAPPRSRGWTRRDDGAQELAGGSPALAGMDPSATSALRPPCWLPRARGDGPLWADAIAQSDKAPPRSRGWTVLGGRHLPGPVGSPALAGMDPHRRCRARSRRRLPRARGDGPTSSSAASVWSEAPPRSRGWTRDAPRAQRRDAGSPALAGMDPSARRRRGARRRLPRARGDGPPPLVVVKLGAWAPPRSRGWTRPRPRHRPSRTGSPALAGMDLFPCGGRYFECWLPRARGDGPRACGTHKDNGKAPPRSRGWTRRRRLVREVDRGSPALAGMDPPQGSEWCSLNGLPRARGDGPGQRRRRVGRPQAPPRSRGWTPRGGGAVRGGAGSPALAGMDPRPRSTGPPRWWLPRARGDGPYGHGPWERSSRAPPRSRGWTSLAVVYPPPPRAMLSCAVL